VANVPKFDFLAIGNSTPIQASRTHKGASPVGNRTMEIFVTSAILNVRFNPAA